MNFFNKDHNKYLVILFSAIMLIIILIVGRIGQKKAQEKSPEAVQETSQVIDRTDTDHTENTTPTEPASAGDSSREFRIQPGLSFLSFRCQEILTAYHRKLRRW